MLWIYSFEIKKQQNFLRNHGPSMLQKISKKFCNIFTPVVSTVPKNNFAKRIYAWYFYGTRGF